MSSQADREIIEALLRQASPYDYPAGAPDLMAQLGAGLEGAGQTLESSLQAENELERFAELIPRWLIANPAKRTGALMRDPEGALEQLKTMVAQAKADPGAAAQAVGRAGIEAVKDPLGTAEGMSALEMLGAGGALTSLAKAGMRLRGPDLVESVMPEAKVERPVSRPERTQRIIGEDAEKARLDRAVQLGFNIDAFHGTKGDISEFDPGLLGTTTGAASARKGFFFSTDPETASAYATESDPVALGRMSQADFDAWEAVYRDEQLELAGKAMEIDEKINQAIGVNEPQRIIHAIDKKIRKLNEQPLSDTRIWHVLKEEDYLGFDTKGEAAGAIIRHDDWASRWDVVNPNTVQIIESWKKAWKREEEQRDIEVGKLRKQRAVAQNDLDLAYEAYEPYAAKHFPELESINLRIEDLEYKIDRGHLGSMGDNIMPVKLKLENPLEYDFSNAPYREVSYHDLLEQAQREGRDGAIFRNTYDGGDLTDIYVVFDPSQIRSRYAMFDPEKSASEEVIAGAAPVVLPLGAGAAAEAYMANQEQ